MRTTELPQWCLLCAGMAFDNSRGHFPGPLPTSGKGEQP